MSQNLQTAFINQKLRPDVAGQHYDTLLSNNIKETIQNFSYHNTITPRERRKIIIECMMSHYSPQTIIFKILLKDIFYTLAARLEK